MKCFSASALFISLAICFIVQVCDSCEECANQEDPAMAGVHDAERESESSAPGSTDVDNGKQDEMASVDELSGDSEESGSISTQEKYKALFLQYRASQLSSIKGLMGISKNEQRYTLVQLMLKNLFKVLEEAKTNVTTLGILPGDPVPEDENARTAYSKVLENTAMFGDLALHLPDAVHSMYDKEEEWKLLLRWCYGFSLESGMFEGPHKIMLNLMAQEVDVIPKEPNFINPFKDINYAKRPEPEKREKQKKPKKKIPRGPKLSHTEL